MNPSLRQLLLKYWRRPRQVVRGALDRPSRLRELVLAVLYGVALMLDRANENSWGETYSLPGIFLRVAAYGVPLGLFVVASMCGTMRLARKIVNGTASFWENVGAVAISTIPATEVLLLKTGITVVFLGREAFISSGFGELSFLPLNGGTVAIVVIIVLLLPFILLFIPWTISLTARSIGEANRVNGWRGFGLAVVGLIGIILAGLAVEGLRRLLGI